MGRYAEAQREFLEAHRVLKAASSEDHPWTLNNITWLRVLYEMWDEPQEAAGPLREIAALLRRVTRQAESEYGPDVRKTACPRSHLGVCLIHLRRYEEAEHELLEAHRALTAAREDWVGWTAKRLTALYEVWGKPAKAAATRAKWQRAAGDRD